MTQLSTYTIPRRATGAPSQDGPVLLATKPFHGLDAPLAVARWLAAREERELHIVSVLEHNDAMAVAAGAPPLPTRYYDEEREALAAQIKREVTPIDASDAPHVDVLDGPSARSVVDAAHERDARVIVIGTGKHDPIGRYIYGERALEIVSMADRPVLVVPRGAAAGPVAAAVVAVDFSAASVRAARAVLPMLSYGGRLILVHVKTAVALREDNTGWWNDAYERRCADLFAQFRRQLPAIPGITVETQFLRGEAARTLIDYGRSRDAGLIACGRLGHSFIARVFVGSVSSALVRQATCPVLVAPELPGDISVPDPRHS